MYGMWVNNRVDIRVPTTAPANMSNLFSSLSNPIFRRLYVAQTISWLGDALSWLGLGLLAFEFAGEAAPVVMASALTVRVIAFVLLSPVAGAIADRCDRKPILVTTHLARMLLVCLLPFVREVWQIYAVVLGLNIFNAIFAPTYQATLPLVTGKAEYPQAMALSSTTYHILGVFGPVIGGVLVLFIGARALFFWDGLSFLIATMLIATLPGNLRIAANGAKPAGRMRTEIQAGTLGLWCDPALRYGLMLQLVAAIAVAQILVNTVSHVKGTLGLTAMEYSWVMMAYGLGATVGTIALGNYARHQPHKTNTSRLQPIALLGGGVLLVTALLPANYVGLAPLMLLWSLAGCGQSWMNLSMQTAIVDRTPIHKQGRVCGAHFAWTHIWWAAAYPLAGWLGNSFPGQNFLYASCLGLGLLVGIHLLLTPDRFTLPSSSTAEVKSIELYSARS
jgi:MFS transporter, NRE family, putaive nickel resistance protein